MDPSVPRPGSYAEIEAGGPQQMEIQDYMKLEDLQKLDHIKAKMATNTRRRLHDDTNPEDRLDFASNYKRLLEIISMPAPTRRNVKFDPRSSKKNVASLGPILDAYRDEQRMEALSMSLSAEESMMAQSRRSGSFARDAVAHAKRLSLFSRKSSAIPPTALGYTAADTEKKGRDGQLTSAKYEPEPLGEDDNLRKAPSHIQDGARSTVYAQSRIEHQNDMKQRSTMLRNLDKTFQEVREETNPSMMRRNSWPPMISSIGALRDFHENATDLVEENIELREVAAQQKPRDQERALEARVAFQDAQIANQLALIKGLRERVRHLSIQVGEGGPGTHGHDSDSDGHLHTVSGGPTPEVTPRKHLQASEKKPKSSSRKKAHGDRAPRGASVTTVVCDIQASSYLLECHPALMETQVPLYVKLLRQRARSHRGYEVDSLHDRFLFAFPNPTDACNWCIAVQVDLNAIQWDPELDELPDTPAELLHGSTSEFLWRGLRVKMGVEMGGDCISDPLTKKVVYEGSAVERSSYFQQLAAGGEILISEVVQNALSSQLVHSGAALLQPAGILEYKFAGTPVCRLVPQKLKDRLGSFQRDLLLVESNTTETMEMSQIRPPEGRVAIVTIVMTDADDLINIAPKAAKTTFKLYREVLIREMKNNRGYASVDREWQHIMVFPDAMNAVRCCMDIQIELMKVQEWPPEALRMLRFSTVNVRETQIFHGPRTQIGVHYVREAPRVAFDPLTGLAQFRGPDSHYAAMFALSALGGEIVVGTSTFDEISQYSEVLGHPHTTVGEDVSIPGADAMVRTYQVVPAVLEPRTHYLRGNRDEEQTTDDPMPDVVRTLERQVGILKKKLKKKDLAIARLEEQLIEKHEAVGAIRKTVLGKPFLRIDVLSELQRLDNGYRITGAIPLVAIGFAHASTLMESWADEMPDAIGMFNDLVDSMAGLHGGTELRRLGSNTERIFTFIDSAKAGEFWLSVCRNSIHLTWPDKLDHSDEAGLKMATDVLPGIDHTQDTIVWRGLRPICAIEVAAPVNVFNPVTHTTECYGDAINHVSILLRHAQEGDCILTPNAATDLKQRILRLNEPLLGDYGVYYRLQASEMTFRNRIMKNAFSTELIEFANPVTHFDSTIVHLTIEDHEMFHEDEEGAKFDRDRALAHDIVAKTVYEHGGRVGGCLLHTYTLLFDSIDRAAAFAMNIQLRLLRAEWSDELLRIREFREIYVEDSMVARGLRVKLGIHHMSKVSQSLDTFSGIDYVSHEENPVSVVLADKAHFGETLVTDAVKKGYLASLNEKTSGEERPVPYLDNVGAVAITEGMVPTSVWQLLPASIRGRAALFIQDDKDNLNPGAAKRRRAAERREVKLRQQLAHDMVRDMQLLKNLDRNENSLDDPIHKRNARLYEQVRQRRDLDKQKAYTSENTLALLETISMISEDPMYNNGQGTAHHHQMMLHHVEYGKACQNTNFRKGYAAELMDELSDIKFPALNDEDALMNTLRGMGNSATSPLGNTFRKQQEHTGIYPEDVVQFHIAVERFSNLIVLHGINDPLGNAVEEWATGYEEQCPEGGSEKLDDRLREMAAPTMAFGMDVGASIRPEEVQRSIVANLTMVMQKVQQSAQEAREREKEAEDSLTRRQSSLGSRKRSSRSLRFFGSSSLPPTGAQETGGSFSASM